MSKKIEEKKRRTGGTVKSKNPKYCKLYVYIQDHDSDLAEVIDRLCLASDLMPGRGNGVTLLYPHDKSYREEIISAYKDGNEEKALQLIRSLIIPDFVKSLSEFGKKVLGSRLGVKFKVDKATDASVEIDGAKVVPATDFKWLKRFDDQKQNVNVFWIEKGKLPLKGEEKYVAPLRQRRPQGKPGDGVKLGGALMNHKYLMLEYLEHAIRDGEDQRYAASMLMCLKNESPKDFQAVLPLLNWEPAITVITVANMPQCLIHLCGPGKWNGQIFHGLVQTQDYRALLDSYKEGAKYSVAIESVRRKILKDPNAPPSAITTPALVSEAYKNLVLSGTINSVGPVYSQETMTLLGPDPSSKKKWLDEMAFNVGGAMLEIRRDMRDFNLNVKNLIHNYIEGPNSGTNYAAELLLLNDTYIKNSVSRDQDLENLKRFVNSSAFLHQLRSQSETSTESKGSFPSANQYAWNIESDAALRAGKDEPLPDKPPCYVELAMQKFNATKTISAPATV